MSDESDTPRSVGEFFGKHPAVVLTLLYLYASALGVLYSWSLFRQFGINIADFAQTGDFVLAAFKQPAALFQSFGAAIGVFFATRNWARQRSAMWEAASRVRSRDFTELKAAVDRIEEIVTKSMGYFVLAVALVVYSILPPLWYGIHDANRTKSGLGLRVIVALETNGDGAIASQPESALILIGTTERYAFFYDPNKQFAHIIPVANIHWMHGVAAARADVTPTTTVVCPPTPTPQGSATATRTAQQ